MFMQHRNLAKMWHNAKLYWFIVRIPMHVPVSVLDTSVLNVLVGSRCVVFVVFEVNIHSKSMASKIHFEILQGTSRRSVEIVLFKRKLMLYLTQFTWSCRLLLMKRRPLQTIGHPSEPAKIYLKKNIDFNTDHE